MWQVVVVLISVTLTQHSFTQAASLRVTPIEEVHVVMKLCVCVCGQNGCVCRYFVLETDVAAIHQLQGNCRASPRMPGKMDR